MTERILSQVQAA